jgi:hypothetical protein
MTFSAKLLALDPAAACAKIEPIGTMFHVRDFLGVCLRDLGRLLDLLVPFLYRRGATAMSLSFLGSRRVETLLRTHLFAPASGKRTVVIDTADGTVLPPVEEWYFTDGDEDT